MPTTCATPYGRIFGRAPGRSLSGHSATHSAGRAIPTRDVIDARSRAQKNGFPIDDRGRISGTVLAAADTAR